MAELLSLRRRQQPPGTSFCRRCSHHRQGLESPTGASNPLGRLTASGARSGTCILTPTAALASFASPVYAAELADLSTLRPPVWKGSAAEIRSSPRRRGPPPLIIRLSGQRPRLQAIQQLQPVLKRQSLPSVNIEGSCIRLPVDSKAEFPHAR